MLFLIYILTDYKNLQYFITALILTYFNLNLKYIIKTDLSNYILKKVLSQYNKNGELYLVAFLFQKLAPAELSYEIYNKELLAIIKYFEQWCLELKGLLFLIYMLTDYKNLQYFIIIKQLIQYQIY